VAVGEELMPLRETKVALDSIELSRKQGSVIQEETVVEDSSNMEGDNEDSKNGGL